MVVFSHVDKQLNQDNMSILPFLSFFCVYLCMRMCSLVNITNNIPPAHKDIVIQKSFMLSWSLLK